jgi:hypothetical protein
MLSIMDPVDVEDMVVFRDDEDPAKFYLLPDKPVISQDDSGVPDFYFIRYRGVDATHTEGGYVQFRTVLTISPERRAKVVAALKTQLTQDQAAGRKPFGQTIASTDPVLADPIWKSGSVSILTMQAGPSGLVTVAPDSALPCDLAGALGAAGRLTLSNDGASIFWASFNDYETKKLPILVTYQLVYRARVSANLTIDADASTVVQQIWKRAQPAPYLYDPVLARYVRLAFSGQFDRPALEQLRIRYPGAQAMVVPDVVRSTIQSCVTDKTITVEINTDESGSGTGANVQDALFKLATDLLTNDIVPAIFGTGPNGTQAQPLPGANSSSDPSATQQVLPLPDQDVSTHFHIQMTSNSVIDCNVNPTGTLQVLISDPKILANCFKELTLGNDFFSHKHVTVSTANLNFDADGISAIGVAGRYTQKDDYGNQPPAGALHPDVTLKSAADTGHWDFALSRDAGGVPKNGYEYTSSVYYSNGAMVTSDWQPSSVDSLIVNPTAMGMVRVQLVLTARRDDVRSVSVALTYRKANGEVLSDVVILSPDENRKTWIKNTGDLSLAAPDAPAPVYGYQFTYDTVAAGKISLPAQTSNADTLEVPTPFPKTLTWNFTPQGSFAGVAAIHCDFTYDDPVHGYRVTNGFHLDSLAAKRSVLIPIFDGGPEQASWTSYLLLSGASGATSPLPPSQGGPANYLLGQKVFPPINVTVMPDLIDFNTDVQVAAVKLTYHDPVTAVDATQDFKFSKTDATQQVWSIPQHAPNLPLAYDLDVRYFGFDRTKNAEFHLTGLKDPTPYLDRTAGASTAP